MLLELLQVGSKYGVRATVPRESEDLEIWYDRNSQSVTDKRIIRSTALMTNISRARQVFNGLVARAEQAKRIGGEPGEVSTDSVLVIDTYGG